MKLRHRISLPGIRIVIGLSAAGSHGHPVMPPQSNSGRIGPSRRTARLHASWLDKCEQLLAVLASLCGCSVHNGCMRGMNMRRLASIAFNHASTAISALHTGKQQHVCDTKQIIRDNVPILVECPFKAVYPPTNRKQ